MNNQSCCGPMMPPPPNPCNGLLPPPPPPAYPFMKPARDSYTYCCCGRVPNPPSSKFPTSGSFVGSGFALKDTNPYLIDTTFTSYGQVLCFSESVYTKVTQRKDPSCINLAATFDMTDTNLTNTVRNSFLDKYIGKKYSALGGVLPIIKSELKFKLHYTITDYDGGVVHEGVVVSTSLDNHFHFTDIRDLFVTSAHNVMIDNIPAMTYAGLYTITIDHVDAYVNVIDTKSHIEDDMNPYYTFYDNNMKIQLQHDTINSETADDELLIASCDVNKSFDYQANVTTRLRITFTAFMSTIIACGDTTGVWEALNSPTDELIVQIQNELESLQDDVKSLHEIIEQQNLLIQKLSNQLDVNTTNINSHTETINSILAKNTDLEERVAKLEAIPLATIPYKKGIDFVKGQLTWTETGKLYQVTENYTSTGSMTDDIKNGKLVAISTSSTELTALTEKVNTIEKTVNESYTNSQIDKLLENKVDKEEGKTLTSNDFTDDDVSTLQSASRPIVACDSILEFPAIGESNKLYVDKSTSFSYVWDDVNKSYLNTDENNINYDTIQAVVDIE